MIRFIAGYPKSGQTWARLFMMAYEAGDAFDMNARPAAHRQDVHRQVWECVSPVPIEELAEPEMYALRSAALVHLMRSVPGPICLKTHAANVQVNRVAMIPPALTERALYVVRDPRDVAVSFADHLGVTIDEAIAKMADPRRALMRNDLWTFISSWSINVQSWTRGADFPVNVARYEDMLADPLAAFGAIGEFFFGFTPDPMRIAQAVHATSFDILRADEESRGYRGKSQHQERFFREGRSGGWQDLLSREQTLAIERDHGAAMAAFGYEPA